MIGQTISHYTIIEKLGEGGMGVVYKAHDTTLDRVVALKFLPPHLASSGQDKARFIQEAKAAATLDHPNICTVYAIDEHEKPASTGAPAGNQLFIAMQYVDGQLLRDKMSGMSEKQALEIGIQVAEGLAAAHEKGVVHRDIKPENIMVRKDGIAQIMDFGLAKLKGVSRLTKEGSTVGTAGYMSPEQVQGQDADHRSDIFSLGVLLYEMLTGQLPFKGVHETAIAYEIVNVDATPMATVKPEIDPGLDAIILECLEKDPNERTQAAKQVAIDLKRYKRESSRQKASRITAARPVYRESGPNPPEAVPAPATSRSRELIPWSIAGILLLGLGALFFTQPSGNDAPGSLIRSSIVLPESLYVHSYGVRMGPPVLSPDGSMIAFTGVTPDGVGRIYVRPLAESESRPIPGTDWGQAPFWAPDGKRLAFFQDGRMKRVDLVGGSPVTIAEVPNSRGGTWNRNDMIVFAPDYQSHLYAVDANGGSKPVPVTELDSMMNEGSHRWPHFLPDGEHVLYLSRAIAETGDAEGDAIYVASLDGAVRKRLVESSFNPAYAGGYLFFARQSALLAQRFDPGSLTLEGDPMILQEGLLTDISYNSAVFTLSQTGLLLYQTGTAIAGARPIFLDRSGTIVRTIEDASEQNNPRFSPDGKQVAVDLYDSRSRRNNIWVYDLRTNGRRRLTTGSEGDFMSIWSPDGRKIFFSSGPIGRRSIFLQSTGHSGPGELFLSADREIVPIDLSPDGSLILYESLDRSFSGDLFLLESENRNAEPVTVAATPFDETDGRFSPDGRWIAYTSDESGRDEVYLLNVDALKSDPWKISSDGAWSPTWGPDGTEVFYVNDNNKMIMKKLRFAGGKGEVVGSEELFRIPAFFAAYDVSPDGKAFIVTRDLEVRDFGPLSLVANWQGLLEQ